MIFNFSTNIMGYRGQKVSQKETRASNAMATVDPHLAFQTSKLEHCQVSVTQFIARRIMEGHAVHAGIITSCELYP